MKIFNLTFGLFIGLVLLFTICIKAAYGIYLDRHSQNAFYVIEKKEYEVNKFSDLYSYAHKNMTKKDYNEFLKNLDKDSKKEVNFIIDSVLLVLNAKELKYKAVKPFSNRQAKEIKKFYKFVYSKKYIDKKTIRYGDYKFPDYNGTVHVLYSKYGMDKVTDKTKKRIINKAIIDAGAYVGDSSVVLSEYTNDKVYAFEPIDENYEKLLRTIDLNDMKDKILPVKLCLGEKKENKILYASIYQPDTSNSKHGDKKYVLKSTSVDDFVKDNNIKVGIIKSDIEGDEMNLLKGAKKTIMEQKPLLLISIYHSGKDFFEIKKWIEDLDLKYKFKIVRTKPDDILDETILIAE